MPVHPPGSARASASCVMRSNGTRHRAEGAVHPVLGSDRLEQRARALVREHPAVVIAGAGVLGIALGGLLFSRLARLLFVAAAGYVANDLWHREGRLDVDQLIEKLSRLRPDRGAREGGGE